MSDRNRKLKLKPSGQEPRRSQKISAPSKAESALLPPFPELPLEHIYLPKTEEECAKAVEEIMAAGITGFDTEAKPTFRKGQKSGGPHLVQFSLSNKAFLFQVENKVCEQAAAKSLNPKMLSKSDSD